MLRKRLNDTLKEVMMAKNQRAVSTVRLILAALKDRDIAARGRGEPDGVGEADIFSMLQTMVRQRQESIELYEKGGRPELAAQEREEITIIEGFLPKAMTAQETDAAVAEVLGEVGATCIKDMGRAMAELRARYAGRMDFAKVSAVVKSKLTPC